MGIIILMIDLNLNFNVISVPCDIENNCNPYAQCEWVESELRNRCVCNPQYEGNGYECTEVEVSCIYVGVIRVISSSQSTYIIPIE